MEAAAGTSAFLQLVEVGRELGPNRRVGAVVVAVLKLKRVPLEVVELLLPDAVLGVHVPLGPDRLEGRLLDQELASLLATGLLRDGDQRAPVQDQPRVRA